MSYLEHNERFQCLMRLEHASRAKLTTLRQIKALVAVDHTPGQSLSDIAKVLQSGRDNACPTLNRLVKVGLIVRKRVKSHPSGSIYTYCSTKAGRNLVEKLTS